MPTRAAVEKLKRDLIAMGEMCENAMSSSVMALIDRDEDLADQTIEYDKEIDEIELAVGNDCVRLLKEGRLTERHLRFVTVAMKLSRELERIGDHAVEVCEHVLFLVRQRTVLPQIVDFGELVEQIGQMMREGIRAIIEEDVDLAWKMIDEHLVVHDEMQKIFSEVLAVMHADHRTIERCCHILAVARALERVGDLATNLAEEVIYLVEGRDIRHHIREHHPVTPHLVPVAESPEEEERREAEVVERHTRRRRKRPGRPTGAGTEGGEISG
jgi:phosphate transport system protein